MIVNHFNTFPYGGAAAAAKRLHHQMLRSNVDSRFLYHQADRPFDEDPSFQRVEFAKTESSHWINPLTKRFEKARQKKIYRAYDRHIAGREPNLELFSMAELVDPTPFDWTTYQADIMQLHWTAFFIDYPSFFGSLPDQVPVVWTLHDMNPLTGGCHYNGGCQQFKSGCGHCPQLVDPLATDLSATAFRAKQKALRKKNITVVTPSRWLGKLAQQSAIWPASTSFHVIKYGFDLEQFQVIDKLQARRQLGVDTDAVLIGFGAEDINNQRKGFQHLLPALEQLDTTNRVECMVFGSGSIPDGFPSLPPIHSFGYINSPEKQAQFYSACDLVVVPSEEDNQPQVGLEAMACGTPVVGFDAGGIREYVLPQVTGLLAEVANVADLSEKIAFLVDQTERRNQMASGARQMMLKEFEVATQTEKYLDLYRDLVLQPTLLAAS